MDDQPEQAQKWLGPLQPYAAFHEHYSRGFKWEPFAQFIIAKSLHQRFRLVVERGTAPAGAGLLAYDIGRDDTLAEQGVWSAEEDAKEFASALFDSIFQYCNELEMAAVADLIAAYIAEQDKYRAEHQ